MNVNISAPNWLQNIVVHAVSGFIFGFSMAFVAKPEVTTLPDLNTAILLSLTAGGYGAIKEVFAYVETLLAQRSTQAAPKTAESTMASAPKLLSRKLL